MSQSREAPQPQSATPTTPEAVSEGQDSRVRAAMMRRALQRKAEGGREPAMTSRAHQAAEKGVAGNGGALPHLDKLQQSFGSEHDLSSVRAHVGGQAAEGSKAIGARAYTTGSSIAFKETPDLRLAAHEATHVIQQRAGSGPDGGVGKQGDAHEQHADQVADAVVSGKSAAPLLAGMKGGASVQRAVQLEGEPEIDATEEKMGEHIAGGMDQANAPPTDANSGAITGGVQYWYNAKGMIEEAGGDFLDGYRYGHHFKSWTAPQSEFFEQPDETGQFMRFEVKPGVSASKAIQEWLRGPTIAECLTTVRALQTDAVRAAIGDKQFDSLFGSEDGDADKGIREKNNQLVISTGPDATIAKADLRKMTEFSEATKDKKLDQITEEDYAKLKPGELYYFKNHPRYLHKHPGGAWQGENAIYMGPDPETQERLWAGLGAAKAPESHMYESMMGDYNRERDPEDYRRMIENHILVPSKTGTEEVDGKKYKYAIGGEDYMPGDFPDQVDEAKIKADGGGFLPGSGKGMDEEKVKKLRPPDAEKSEEDSIYDDPKTEQPTEH